MLDGLISIVSGAMPYVWIALGFSAVIFVHELGHFAVAKWAGVRVDRFAIGFGREIVGFTRGETRYSFNILPLGGYVKMMGQEDFEIDTTGEITATADPRSFANKSVGHRAAIVSAGVIMNVLFAALLFMIVFMVGKNGQVAQIGMVLPDTPAAQAGLMVGDRILRINDKQINEYSEVQMSIMLAEPHEPLRLTIEREGSRQVIEVIPENDPNQNRLVLGIESSRTREIILTVPVTADRAHQFWPGDRLIEANGTTLTDENVLDVMCRLMLVPGTEPLHVVAERIGEDGTTREVSIDVEQGVRIGSSELGDNVRGNGNVLGFRPLTRISDVEEKSRAYYAGIKAGDLLLRWGDTLYPTVQDVLDITRSHPEHDLRVDVRRKDTGRVARLVVRPKQAFRLIRTPPPPRVGITFEAPFEGAVVLGRSAMEIDGRATAAAGAEVPADSTLRAVNGSEIANWSALIEALRVHAGERVTLEYATHDGVVRQAQMDVPHCPRSLLGLEHNALSLIREINGQATTTVEINGVSKKVSISFANALREVLKSHVGETVTVTYQRSRYDALETASLAVTADMVDPWLGRIIPDLTLLAGLKAKTALIQTNNPIKAMWIGVQKTAYFVLQVYTTMERMIFSRSVGVENISGPVGIVQVGASAAKQGLVQFLFLLAIISANLAVINFLPLPIVDGGHIVFLIIEKIKGSPVPIKMQVATQIIGIVLIAMAFLFVTLQDISRL